MSEWMGVRSRCYVWLLSGAAVCWADILIAVSSPVSDPPSDCADYPSRLLCGVRQPRRENGAGEVMEGARPTSRLSERFSVGEGGGGGGGGRAVTAEFGGERHASDAYSSGTERGLRPVEVIARDGKMGAAIQHWQLSGRTTADADTLASSPCFVQQYAGVCCLFCCGQLCSPFRNVRGVGFSRRERWRVGRQTDDGMVTKRGTEIQPSLLCAARTN